MRILTANIRCACGGDGDNAWEHRKGITAEVLRSRNADIILFQEMWAIQFKDLQAAFPEYSWYGAADEPGDYNMQNVIFFQTNMFELLSSGCFWLSETPHIPGSRSWKSAYIRLAAWVHLRDLRSGREFRVINTHLDNKSQDARMNQTRVITEHAAVFDPNLPQILGGDLNASPDNPLHALLKDAHWADSWAAVHGDAVPAGSFHFFEGADYDGETSRIDWIYTRGSIIPQAAVMIEDNKNGSYPSDHYFIEADFEFADI